MSKARTLHRVVVPKPRPDIAGALAESVLSYGALLETQLPERSYLLPWLPEGGLAMVYAPRGLGKTFFGLSLAVAVANGTRFLRWDVTHPAGVLYLDGEMALYDIRERLRGFMSSPPQLPFGILSHEWFYEKTQRDLSVTDMDIQEAVIAYLDESRDVGLLVIDNLSCLCRIREDKSDDWREYVLPFLLDCRRRGVAVLIVHHTGKGWRSKGNRRS